MIQWFATLGVGGALAGFMFIFYRKDTREYADLWKSQTELWKAQNDTLLQVVRENTVSNTKLVTLIETMERNSQRIADLHGKS